MYFRLDLDKRLEGACILGIPIGKKPNKMQIATMGMCSKYINTNLKKKLIELTKPQKMLKDSNRRHRKGRVISPPMFKHKCHVTAKS